MVTMETKNILTLLPYKKPFLFVDELLSVDENGTKASYTYTADHDFYRGHFENHPVTPGVILTETMAQAGLVCLGIYLLRDSLKTTPEIALTSTEIEFLKPVYPSEKVFIESEKVYFRFGKLKCKVLMKNTADETVCKGTIAGMILIKK